MKKLFWIFLIPAIVCGCQTRSQTPASRTVNLPQMHQQAKDIIREALADENPHIRTNAVEVAASTKQLEMMPMVEHLLTDEYSAGAFCRRAGYRRCEVPGRRDRS